jgi:murein DD-endopeptidase MepM/ murein hydrolase activator NlpD
MESILNLPLCDSKSILTKNKKTVVKKTIQQKKPAVKVDILMSCLLALTLISGYKKIEALADQKFGNTDSIAFNNKVVTKFGFDTNIYHLSSITMGKGDIVGDIFYENGIDGNLINAIQEKAKDIFSVTKIRPGKNIHVVKQDSCGKACAFVYEASPLHYVVYDLRKEVDVKVYERPYETCVESKGGVINGSLWNTLEEQGVNPAIIDKMEDALASSVDFYHTQKGDEFKLVYEKKYVDGEEIGLGKLIGAYYKNESGSHYSVLYEKGEYNGYYDYQGRPAKSTFLKSPVKFTRISSGFNLRRFHPIRRMTIPHLGTDYAAPYGTPIRAVADGVVEEAAYTGNNGKYVKLKHDRVYQTQYLHMQGFASGIKRGARVRQGSTIGYVGSTGLATGPHVCFRFWKNGRQVNHLREVFQPAKPMPHSELPMFFEHRDKIKQLIDQIPLAKEIKSNEA